MRISKPIEKSVLLLAAGLSFGGAALSGGEVPDRSEKAGEIAISEPGFEADGDWKLARNGAGVKGLFLGDHLANYTREGMIDPLPRLGRKIAYNNGPEHDVYQVLAATVTAETTYRLSVVVVDATFSNPFPGGELRLETVSGSPTASDDYGLNLLTPMVVESPVPFNDREKAPGDLTDGFATWTWTFTTGARPLEAGRKLRIEIVGGGRPQALFDNVRLEARPATLQELEAAAKASQHAVSAPVVVMFGDSTTERGLPAAVKKELVKLEAPDSPPLEVINAGKGGDNATAALGRLEQDVLARNPDLVTVSFGLNDTGLRNPDQFEDSLGKMVGMLESAGIRVLLVTSTPFNNKRHGWAGAFEELGGLDEYLNKEYCQRMRSLGRSEMIPLCDLHAIFAAEFAKEPGRIEELLSADGVHLEADGYALMAEHLAPRIIELLRKDEEDLEDDDSKQD